MGDYFDAIYNRDVADIERLDDKKYLSTLRAHLRSYRQDPVLGGLFKLIDAKDASLVSTIVKQYTHQYKTMYSKCLRSDSVTYTQHTTMKDRFGTHEYDTVFQVNPELEEALTNSTSDGEQNNLGDLRDLVYGAPLARAGLATSSLMTAFRCDDSRIKRFESNLASVYAAKMAKVRK